MTAFLHDLGPALWAETLKTKRTLAVVLAFLAPALVAALNFIIYWQRGSTLVPEDRSIWLSLAQNNLVFWNLLMVPLFIALQTALLAGVEHAHKNWKLLFALPVSRGAVYTAKQAVAMGLIGLSSLVLWAAIIGSGLLLGVVKPGIGFEQAIPAWPILKFILVSFVTSWLIISIHAWIGMRWPSFVVAMGVGIAAMIVAVVIVQSDYPLYYPWTLPGAITLEFIRTGVPPYGLMAVGALGGIAAAVVGGLEFIRRDVL